MWPEKKKRLLKTSRFLISFSISKASMPAKDVECTTSTMPWMTYEMSYPTLTLHQCENWARSPLCSWPKITSWCKEMHSKNSEDLSPICHKSPESHCPLPIQPWCRTRPWQPRRPQLPRPQPRSILLPASRPPWPLLLIRPPWRVWSQARPLWVTRPRLRGFKRVLILLVRSVFQPHLCLHQCLLIELLKCVSYLRLL